MQDSRVSRSFVDHPNPEKELAHRRLALLRVLIWAAAEAKDLSCDGVSIHIDSGISALAEQLPDLNST